MWRTPGFAAVKMNKMAVKTEIHSSNRAWEQDIAVNKLSITSVKSVSNIIKYEIRMKNKE